MKRLLPILVLVSLCIPHISSARINHSQLLLHGKRTIDDSSHGIAGWIIATDMLDAPAPWIATLGHYYESKSWWVQVMGGVLIDQENTTPLVSIAAEFFNFEHSYAWTNIQLIADTDDPQLYHYLQIDYKLPHDLAKIGLETENTFQSEGKSDLAWGPQLIITIGNLDLLAAYHPHVSQPDQFWLRSILNF